MYRANIKYGYVIRTKDAVNWANAVLQRTLKTVKKETSNPKETPNLTNSPNDTAELLAILREEVKLKGGCGFRLHDDRYMAGTDYDEFQVIVHETSDYLEMAEDGALILQARHMNIDDLYKREGKKLLEEQGM